MTTRIDVHRPSQADVPAGRRRFSWSSGLIVLACLAAQLWVVANVSEPGRAPLLVGSILLEYIAIAWCEGRAG